MPETMPTLRIDVLKAEAQANDSLTSSPSTPNIADTLAAISLSRSKTLSRIPFTANETVKSNVLPQQPSTEVRAKLHDWILGIAIGKPFAVWPLAQD